MVLKILKLFLIVGAIALALPVLLLLGLVALFWFSQDAAPSDELLKTVFLRHEKLVHECAVAVQPGLGNSHDYIAGTPRCSEALAAMNKYLAEDLGRSFAFSDIDVWRPSKCVEIVLRPGFRRFLSKGLLYCPAGIDDRLDQVENTDAAFEEFRDAPYTDYFGNYIYWAAAPIRGNWYIVLLHWP